LGDHLSTRILFTAGYASAIAIGLPAGTLSLVGGSAFGALLGFGLNYAAIIAGAAGGYWLARIVGERTTRRILQGRHAWLDRLNAGGAHGFGTLIGLQLSPLFPNSIVNLAAGVARLDFSVYLASVVLGNLLPTAAYSYVGAMVLGAQSRMASPVTRAIQVVGVTVTVVLVVVPLARWVRNRYRSRTTSS
jgi:uncharacterized membrane protein YdjX (TVP38/TMEM64 family)